MLSSTVVITPGVDVTPSNINAVGVGKGNNAQPSDSDDPGIYTDAEDEDFDEEEVLVVDDEDLVVNNNPLLMINGGIEPP